MSNSNTTSHAGLRRLMDGVDDGTLEAITVIAADVDGVQTIDRVRARWSGHRLHAQLELGVDANLTVHQGHRIAQHVHHQLLHAMPHLDHALIHLNPVHHGRAPTDAHELTDHHLAARN